MMDHALCAVAVSNAACITHGCRQRRTNATSATGANASRTPARAGHLQPLSSHSSRYTFVSTFTPRKHFGPHRSSLQYNCQPRTRSRDET